MPASTSPIRPVYHLRGRRYTCGIDVALAVIGGKWKASILWHLGQQTMRFSELQRQFATVTRKMLTQQLRELEADELVHREVYPQVPPKVEYSLTELGRTLVPLLDEMCAWAGAHIQALPTGQLQRGRPERVSAPAAARRLPKASRARR